MKYWCGYVTYGSDSLYDNFKKIVPEIEEFFINRSYGSDVENLDTVLNCSPGGFYNQRSKFDKKEKSLYFDILLDYNYFLKLTNAARKNYIAECFISDMNILHKYKPKGFILNDLKLDFKKFFQGIDWMLPDE